jgi:hypothetical protein
MKELLELAEKSGEFISLFYVLSKCFYVFATVYLVLMTLLTVVMIYHKVQRYRKDGLEALGTLDVSPNGIFHFAIYVACLSIIF